MSYSQSSSPNRRMVHDYLPDTNDNYHDDTVTTSTSNSSSSYTKGSSSSSLTRNQPPTSYPRKYQDHTDRTEDDDDEDGDEEENYLQEVSLGQNGGTSSNHPSFVNKTSKDNTEFYSDIEYHEDILHRNSHYREKRRCCKNWLQGKSKKTYFCAVFFTAIIILSIVLMSVLIPKHNVAPPNPATDGAWNTPGWEYNNGNIPPNGWDWNNSGNNNPAPNSDYNTYNNDNNPAWNNNDNTDPAWNNNNDNNPNDWNNDWNNDEQDPNDWNNEQPDPNNLYNYDNNGNNGPNDYDNDEPLAPPIYIDTGRADAYIDQYVSGRYWVSDIPYVTSNASSEIYYGCNLNDFVRMDMFTTGDDGNSTTKNTTSISIENTRTKLDGDVWDPEIFCNERWFNATGRYEILLPFAPPAVYKVSLYFNELFFNKIGDRTFDIHVEGKTIKNDFDILNAADGEQYTVVVLESYHIITDIELSIALIPTGKMNHAKITAIVVEMVSTRTNLDVTSNVILRKINHPTFVLKAVNKNGDEVKQNEKKKDNNITDDSDPADFEDYDPTVVQVDDNVNDNDDASTNEDNTPTYSPTATNFPTTWIATDDQYVPNAATKIDENSVHIAAGLDEPYLQSTTSDRIWFDDGQFISSQDKGRVIGKCNGTQMITGLIEFQDDPFVGCKERIFDSVGTYEIPLPVTIEQTLTFNVTLYFSESYFSEVGARIFDVYMEDKLIHNNVDIYNETRAKNTLYAISSMVYIPDGLLSIKLVSVINDAKINAIVVRPFYDYDRRQI